MISWDYLPREYGQATTRGAGSLCLTTCTRAVALAHYGQKANDDVVRNLARKTYGQALGQINAALRKQEEAVSDATMMAVHLSLIFEVSFPIYLLNPAPIRI